MQKLNFHSFYYAYFLDYASGWDYFLSEQILLGIIRNMDDKIVKWNIFVD